MSLCNGSRNCKVCHGPLVFSAATAPTMQITAFRLGQAIPPKVECHANCLVFACPGCVQKDRTSYQILNLKNHIYDYHCSSCMEEVPPSRRGSMESDYGSISMSSSGAREPIC